MRSGSFVRFDPSPVDAPVSETWRLGWAGIFLAFAVMFVSIPDVDGWRLIAAGVATVTALVFAVRWIVLTR